MPELEQQLFNIFAMAWDEAAPPLVGTFSSLKLVAQQEAVGEDLPTALEAAPMFTSAFVASCSGALSGVLLCLFKKEDRQQVELLISKILNTEGPAGVCALLNSTLSTIAPSLPAEAAFGEIGYVDFASADAATLIPRLTQALGGKAWVNTFTLSVGERLNSQLVVVYAPYSSMEAIEAVTNAAAPRAAAAGAASTNNPASTSQKRVGNLSREDSSRNMERLLEVELEVVVRFGLTQMPLRELVRIGVGSMIELNRQVDEPVELLVNNRPLARGSVVVVDGYYGVCITEIGQIEERRQSLTKM